MNNINFNVAGNKITLTGTAQPVSGSVSYDKCAFTFDSEWNGFTKHVVFSMGNGEEESVVLTGTYCNIPENFLRKSGLLKIGVTGINPAGTLISTDQAALRIRTGANETQTIPMATANDVNSEGGGVG